MIRGVRFRRRISRRTVPVLHAIREATGRLAALWRRSLQLRVVVSTLTLSLVVMSVLGFVLMSQITQRLLELKVNAAVDQTERARFLVEGDLSGTSDTGSLESRLDAAVAVLTTRGGAGRGDAGEYTPVLIAPDSADGSRPTSGPADQIPANLQAFVRSGQIATQWAQVSWPESSSNDAYSGTALLVGTPTERVGIPGLELYLIFPMSSEEQTITLVRGTLLAGVAVLLVLLAAISMIVARQVVLPIRSASRIAVRFADGRLKERMPVRGEDDIARLAMSFNEMAESLSRQIQQLEEFGNLQRRFTSDVSHELRTPLTTVRMAADLIHDSNDGLDPTLARASELLVAELDRFETLLNDLLEISRHDAGVAELSSEQLDLRMCARAAVSTVRHLAKETGTELIVDLPTEPVLADVDPRRVERILRNLLANALDHGEGKPVLMRLRADDFAAAFIVRDQGVGLRPGEEKLVFNRFWRSDPSRVRRSGGTGLGLAISVEDARLHNGRLEAWGEPGKGACFRLTLPLVRGRKVGRSPLPLKPSGVRGVQGRSVAATAAPSALLAGTSASRATSDDETVDSRGRLRARAQSASETPPPDTAPPGSTPSGKTAPGSTSPGNTSPGSTSPGNTSPGSAPSGESAPHVASDGADPASRSDHGTRSPGAGAPQGTAAGDTAAGDTATGGTPAGGSSVDAPEGRAR